MLSDTENTTVAVLRKLLVAFTRQTQLVLSHSYHGHLPTISNDITLKVRLIHF